jgi:DNA-binding beta-propeller fold protein YncE
VFISQASGPEEPKFNTTSPTLYNGHEYVQNVLYKLENKPEDWLGEHNGAFEVKTKDPGVGISYFGMSVGAWVKHNELFNEGKCKGIQCPSEFNQTFTYNKEMGDGDDGVQALAQDGDLYYGPTAQGTIKVDNTPPSNLAITGLPVSGVINEAQYHLQVQATDGKAPTPSSGVKSLALGLDGYTLPGKSGSCTPGPCSAIGAWTINGETFGAGKHTLTLVATDYAGNVEKKEYSITVRHASPLSVAPGSVDPITGAFRLGASDVSLSGGRGTLGVSRSYNSRQLTEGEQGPFGPQWSISVSGSQTVEQESTGSVVLVSPDGGRTTFESNGKGGYIAPKGDENLVLEAEKEGEKIKAYLLKTPAAGTTVKYVQPGGSGPWVISSSEGSLTKTNGAKETVEWERLEGVTRPKLALAPAPAGVTCSPTVKEPKELSDGCRALSFTYATETTATGEAPSQWKAYKGRLMQVSLTAYNPSTKAMETKPVAEYAYDKQGRLRAEWDPRITPSPLKTTYGYDSEGHAVAVNPPGQEPLLLHYGTTASDTSAGRLLSVMRPPAGTPTQVKEQDEKAAPENTAVPTLSNTSPVIGTTLSVSSNGTWSNSPLAYSYAWEDCYTYESKETCTTIPGAVNSTYTPQARDAGYTLRAQITAVNADGAALATTAASKVLAVSAPVYLRKFGEKGESESGQFKSPAAAAIDASGDVWVIDHGNNRVQEWSATGTWLHTYGKKGTGTLQFENPEGIAINQGTGNIYVADKGNNRIEELTSKGAYVRTFGEKGSESGKLNSPVGVAIASNGNIWVGDYANNRVDEFTETGSYLGAFGSEGSGNGQFKGPTGIAFSGEYAYVVDSGNDRVQEFSMSGEFIRKFGSKGTGEGQLEVPYGIAIEPVSGDLYVADSANSRIEEFNPAGTFLLTYGKKGEGSGEFSSPQSVTVNSTGDIYVPDSGNNRVQELEPKYSTNNPPPEPPALGTGAVSTIAYNVPLSGTGAPHEMTKTKLEELWQLDDPAEPVPGQSLATAVFPPDEPMGWPAKDYKRATITYLDELGRTVNRAFPSGGISTSEYNETNEVIRSLSADNRAAALKESNPREDSVLFFDTKSRYNGETKEEKEKEEKAGAVEPGTRLLETRGPRRSIKLATGTEVKARSFVKYYYDEGAPEGEKFNLVTKTTDGAEYEGVEADVRTTTTSYSGQSNLGWLLRKPTSTTVDPGGLNLTHTTVYEPNTGAVTETTTPAGAAGTGASYDDVGHFQWCGTAAGDAVDAAGDIWVAQRNCSAVAEFAQNGQLIKVLGWGVINGKEEFQVCTERCKEGISGTHPGQFRSPAGIAISPTTGNVYVSDNSLTRLGIQEFEPNGKFVREIGSTGSEAEKVVGGWGVAVTPNGSEVWVMCNNEKVDRFSESGAFKGSFGKRGSGHGEFGEASHGQNAGIVFADGGAWISDPNNHRIQEFTMEGVWKSEISAHLESPRWIAADPGTGELFVGDWNGEDEIKEFDPSGKFVGAFLPECKNESEGCPGGLAVNNAGVIYEASERNGQVEVWEPSTVAAPTYSAQFGNSGSETEKLGAPGATAIDGHGNIWVTDGSKNRIVEFSTTDKFTAAYGSEGTGADQFRSPAGIAINQNTGNIYVADKNNNRIEVLNSEGKFVSVFGWGVNNSGGEAEICTTSCRAGRSGSGSGEFSSPVGVAVDGNGNVWVVDEGNNRIEEFNAEGKWLATYSESSGIYKEPHYIAAVDGYKLLITDTGNNRIVELSTSGAYIGSRSVSGKGGPVGIAVAPSSGFVYVSLPGEGHVIEYNMRGFEKLAEIGSEGSGNGQLKEAGGIAVNNAGSVYVADTGNKRVEEWKPPVREIGKSGSLAHKTRTIYYTAGENGEFPACGKHPEWANLPCQSQLVGQPEDTLPKLPVVSDTYNMWDEPETVEETFGSTTRTKRLTYDGAGRALTSEETSTGSSDTAVPKVADEYSSETGVMIKQSTTVGETTKSIKSVYDTLGQLTEYTDADGNATQYVYSGPANDGQVEEIKYGGNRGSQMYSYDPTTKALAKLLDVGPEGSKGAGTFTANYDVEGKMTSETYPNGMTAKYTYNFASEATGIEYEKTTHCASTCPEVWFKEAIVPSIHGEALVRTSTLAKEEYAYDSTGRLTQVNETPTGKGCKTRLYGYSEDSDRTSETTRESATETCATTGGTEGKHTYDEADRLNDTGVEYEAFGNQTKIPAADAGEHEITASFYVDSQIAVQKQNGETTNYTYDPEGRTEKTVSEGTTKATVVNHYPGPGEAISWACEEAAKECEEGKGTKWTRNIPGIDGSLAATQHDSEAAVLQLHDLEGNVVATAAVSETETKLLTTYNPTEFGVQVNGTPPTKYSWLGAGGLATEQASGAANPGGGSYVPQLGRPLQTEPVAAPGAYANGSYNGTAYTTEVSAQAITLGNDWATGAPAREAAHQKQLEEEALAAAAYAAKEAEIEARLNAPMPTQGGAEEPEWDGTIGDPVPCNVYAYEPGQEDEVTGHHMEGWGSFECAHAVPKVTFEVCIQEQAKGKWRTVHCDVIMYEEDTSGGETGASIDCKVGTIYRTWAWLGSGREKGIPKHSGSVECEENLAEVGVGLI